MRTKFTIILLLGSLVVFGQKDKTGSQNPFDVENSVNIDDLLIPITKSLRSQLENGENLISNLTYFYNLKKDFSTIAGLSNNSVSRYAEITADSEEQTFSIKPFNFVRSDSLGVLNKRYHVWNVGFAGKLNGSGFFNFENKNYVEGSVTFSSFFGSLPFEKIEKDSIKASNEKSKKIYNEVIDLVKKQIETSVELSRSKLVTDSLNSDIKTLDSSAVVKFYLEKVAEYENKLTSEYYNTKQYFWYSITIKPLAFTNFEFIDETQVETLTDPRHKTLYTPSVSGSINGNIKNKKNNFFSYFKMAVILKNSLSEIGNKKDWNAIQVIDDTHYYSDDSKEVYVMDEDEINQKIIPDFNLGLTWLHHFKKFSLGIDAQYNNKGFINPTNDKNGRLHKFSIGIVIPFIDKEGESTLNVVPFYSKSLYKNFEVENSSFWGVRFNIPIGKL